MRGSSRCRSSGPALRRGGLGARGAPLACDMVPEPFEVWPQLGRAGGVRGVRPSRPCHRESLFCAVCGCDRRLITDARLCSLPLEGKESPHQALCGGRDGYTFPQIELPCSAHALLRVLWVPVLSGRAREHFDVFLTTGYSASSFALILHRRPALLAMASVRRPHGAHISGRHELHVQLRTSGMSDMFRAGLRNFGLGGYAGGP